MEKFSYEQNGYSRREVNQFIGEVIRETEGIINRVKDQKQKIIKQEEELSKLRMQLEQYKQVENTLKQALINAEKTSDNIKKNARDESDIIIKEARNNANRIVNDALLRAEKIEINADTLERNMRIFKKKLKSIIEQQLSVVEEIETLELE